jgi:N-acetylglutamate synthase-like GNAT family acetyltransferase
LVNLLKLPRLEPLISDLEGQGVIVRRAQPFELTIVRNFIAGEFSVSWADEVSVGFANKPVSVHIATLNGVVIGFAAYECTRKDFFGPAGVAAQMQGRGIGKALLLASLLSLRELGYVYAIIGSAGPLEFYQKAVGATVIADSEPGIYTDLLKQQ